MLRLATQKARTTIINSLRLLVMPIISLGALLSLELALLKARKKKPFPILPIVPISRAGLENTIESFHLQRRNVGTWYYLILLEKESLTTSAFSISITMRHVPTSFEPSRVTLAVSQKLTEIPSPRRIVHHLSYEL